MAQVSLTDPSLTIIIATTPLGLGHLRVTDALYHGLPRNASPILLGARSDSTSGLYRFISNHVITRNLMEISQLPPFERPVAYVWRKILRSQIKGLAQSVKTVLSERFVVSQTIVMVATQPVHGHQLGAIKEKLSQELGAKIILVVQVTDDSPQYMWYVSEADCIFVPSVYTKEHLETYARKARLPHVPIVVTAYPVSPLLTEELSEHAFSKKLEQVSPVAQTAINMTVPVSGAAVGMGYTLRYIDALHRKSSRFLFHVVSKEAPYTRSFIEKMTNTPYVMLHTSIHDRTTVANYEEVFTQTPIALEITKPSEQAFKALIPPKDRGGVIMLLAKPVGRQEYDNLHFLKNHGFMPHERENEHLWKQAQTQQSIDPELFEKAYHWRALLLPEDPSYAAVFTQWCLQERLFERMMKYKRLMSGVEVQPNGVDQFWAHVTKLVASSRV